MYQACTSKVPSGKGLMIEQIRYAPNSHLLPPLHTFTPIPLFLTAKNNVGSLAGFTSPSPLSPPLLPVHRVVFYFQFPSRPSNRARYSCRRFQPPNRAHFPRVIHIHTHHTHRCPCQKHNPRISPPQCPRSVVEDRDESWSTCGWVECA
jgi:hypothetical protein